jgi:hypothetical protein
MPINEEGYTDDEFSHLDESRLIAGQKVLITKS